MEIRSISAIPVAPRIGRVPDTEPAASVTARTLPQAAASPTPRSGPVEATKETPAAPHEARYARDDETNRLVLSMVDPGTGEVIVQLPTKAALRAQAYANEIAARSAVKPSVALIA